MTSAALCAAVPSLVVFLLAPSIPNEELRKVLYAGAGTLLFGGLLGGVLKLILDEVGAAKRRRDDAVTFTTNVLSDLKRVYDQAASAQLLIGAHRSAKTYGDELRGLIEATVQLRNVKRALTGRVDGIAEDRVIAVAAEVETMGQYLGDLTNEFRLNYKKLSDSQRSYEAKAEAMVKKFAEEPTGSTPPLLPTFVWDSIAELPLLKDFIANGDRYKNQFERPLDRASGHLRIELTHVLRRNSWRYTTDASYLSPASSTTSKNADVEQAGRDDTGEA
jgi:hypothetical protein